MCDLTTTSLRKEFYLTIYKTTRLALTIYYVVLFTLHIIISVSVLSCRTMKPNYKASRANRDQTMDTNSSSVTNWEYVPKYLSPGHCRYPLVWIPWSKKVVGIELTISIWGRILGTFVECRELCSCVDAEDVKQERPKSYVPCSELNFLHITHHWLGIIVPW